MYILCCLNVDCDCILCCFVYTEARMEDPETECVSLIK